MSRRILTACMAAVMAVYLASCARMTTSHGDGHAEIAMEDKMMEKEKYAIINESASSSYTPPSESGLKAGYEDDNKQYNYFVTFLQKFKTQARHFEIDISERFVFSVKDTADKPLPNAAVTINADGNTLVSGKTYADGTFMFFPSEYGTGAQQYLALIAYGQTKKEISFERSGKRKMDVRIDTTRALPSKVPVDIVFVLDTTSSMGEEAKRLRSTIEIIHMNLVSIKPEPDLRFGMVLYRDVGDEYVTKVIPLTSSIDDFRREVNNIDVAGGGDTEEDMQSAMNDLVNRMQWNNDGIRMAFLITDAPAHLDYEQTFTYIQTTREAKKNAIKIYSIGTGGLDISGEYQLRQIAQYTYGKYIFLTYGEKGESVGGEPGSVSHHTGANFQTDKLETIILRFAKEEIGYVVDKPLEEGEDYFEATKKTNEKNEDTLKTVFDMVVRQLADFSSVKIPEGMPSAVIPFVAQDEAYVRDAEYFTEQAVFSLTQNKTFKAVERKDLQKIINEMKIQMSGLTDEANAVEVGKILGARMLITGKVFRKGDIYEIFPSLLNVETGEILAVTKAKLDAQLGISK